VLLLVFMVKLFYSSHISAMVVKYVPSLNGSKVYDGRLVN